MQKQLIFFLVAAAAVVSAPSAPAPLRVRVCERGGARSRCHSPSEDITIAPSALLELSVRPRLAAPPLDGVP
jgi:hypothetical protein